MVLQCLSASVKVPARMNLERNDDRTDGVRTLAIGGRWPPRTWGSLLERALFLADRAHRLADRSGGAFRLIETALDLEIHLERVARGEPSAAGLLTIEGAHALEDDPANVEVVADAGFRMISPAHFFDTAFGGSAHGVEQHGLTARGREMLLRMEAKGLLLDVAHASARDDRRRDRAGDPADRRVAHGRPRHLRQRAQPHGRPPHRDRRDGRPGGDRVLADRLRG